MPVYVLIFPDPVLPFLVFLEFLVFSPCADFLVFLSVFPFFSRDFRGSVGIKNPCFFCGFPCLFPKKQGKEGQGSCVFITNCAIRICDLSCLRLNCGPRGGTGGAKPGSGVQGFWGPLVGIVQKGVFGKGVGNSQNASDQKCVRNASKVRQKCVKMGLLYWEKRNVQNASEIRQNCVKNARNTFGGEHLLDDTDLGASEFNPSFQKFGVLETPSQRPLGAPERLSGPRGRLVRGLGEVCPFSKERKEGG